MKHSVKSVCLDISAASSVSVYFICLENHPHPQFGGSCTETQQFKSLSDLSIVS